MKLKCYRCSEWPCECKDGQTIIHGDCREVLPLLEPVDLVLTDPPYGVGITSFDDNMQIGIQGVSIARGKRMACFMSPRKVFEFWQGVATWNWERVLWMHKSSDIAHPWRGWHMNGEVIIVASTTRDHWPVAETTRSDLYSVAFSGGKNGHPAAKPISVVHDLTVRLSYLGATILDPFLGSGTTLRACKDLGRRGIGIEIEERYCEIAAKRLVKTSFGVMASMNSKQQVMKASFNLKRKKKR